MKDRPMNSNAGSKQLRDDLDAAFEEDLPRQGIECAHCGAPVAHHQADSEFPLCSACE